jgi:hypothetical protein
VWMKSSDVGDSYLRERLLKFKCQWLTFTSTTNEGKYQVLVVNQLKFKCLINKRGGPYSHCFNLLSGDVVYVKVSKKSKTFSPSPLTMLLRTPQQVVLEL